MAKKAGKPTISQIAKDAKARRIGSAEDKTKWIRDLKISNPTLAKEVLDYVKQWIFEPNSEARDDCETKNQLREAVQATLDANKINVLVEKTTFSCLVTRLERAYEQGS